MSIIFIQLFEKIYSLLKKDCFLISIFFSIFFGIILILLSFKEILRLNLLLDEYKVYILILFIFFVTVILTHYFNFLCKKYKK